MNVAVACEAVPETRPRAVVHKFGGSSLADAAAIRQAAGIVTGETVTPCYGVVSAAWGVTNALLECLRRAAAGEDWQRVLDRLRRRQTGLLGDLLTRTSAQPLRDALREDFRRLRQLLQAVDVLRAASPETADAVAGHGELWSMRLFTAVLQERGLDAIALDARRFLCVRKAGGEVAVDWDASAAGFAREARNLAGIIVVPGFVASCAERGITLTLGRNGSDWSATILARLADAASVTIWSDVPGVLDGDPAVVAGATTQPRLGFAAVCTLATHGARILHPATLEPLAGRDLRLQVRCTFSPQGGATSLEDMAPAPAVMVSANCEEVSAIGSDVPALSALTALARARVPVRTGEIRPGRVSVRLARADIARAQRIWHRRLCRRRRQADVLLIGTGRVGGAFLKALAERGDAALRLLGVANSTGACLSENALAPQRARRALRTSRSPCDPSAFAGFLLGHCEGAPVIVDATASAAIARWHARWLQAGIHVVTANKLAAAGGWVTDADRERACYGDAATVGAGLPVLDSLRRLRRAGDRIECVEGILSGSLAFLFHALEGGRSFAGAVAAACRAGYMEPYPGRDLAGEDVACKLAILADAAGIAAEIAPPQPVVPAALLALDTATLTRGLSAFDAEWKSAVREARAKNCVIRYVASLAASGENRIGPRVLPGDAPLAGGQGAETIVVIRSRACGKQPLAIRGPGAGPEVTARALLADLATILERCG